MKYKHTIYLILISSKWVIPSFGVCSWWINSSFKCFIFSFPEFNFPRPFRRNLHQNHRKTYLILSSFISISSSFLLPEFFMVVLHDLIFSSRVHQDSCWRSSSILFFSRLEVQLILRILLNWSSAFLHSSQLSNHFRLRLVITS